MSAMVRKTLVLCPRFSCLSMGDDFKAAGRRRLVVTGFGPFHGVPINPTTLLITLLIKELQGSSHEIAKTCEFSVLETSAEGSLETLRQLQEGCSCSDGSVRPTIFVHLGVDTNATEFHLESRAFNEMNFRVPDMKGATPQKVPILDTISSLDHCLYSTIPIDTLVERLSKDYDWSVSKSDDAGRYVCNFVYMNSQFFCHNGPTNCHEALFVHVPPQEVIALDRQVKFIIDLLDLLCTGCQTTTPPPVLAPPPSLELSVLLSMGFGRDMAEAALAYSSGSLDLAVNALLSGVPILEGNTSSEDSGRHLVASAPHKLVLAVRQDLKMSTGKIAAQCCHAALGAYEEGMVKDQSMVTRWQEQGEAVIVVKCPDLATMEGLRVTAMGVGLPVHVVRDAGRTQVDPGTYTVLAVGPGPSAVIDTVTGHLSLL